MPGEGDGLLGATGDTGRVEHHDLGVGVALLDVGADVGVVGTTTAHEDLVDLLARGVSAVVVDDGLRGDAGDGGDDVVGGETLRLGLLDELEGKSVTEDLTTGGLGGVKTEVLVGQELVNELLVNGTGLAHGTVAVVLLLAVGVVADNGVNEDVTWSSVEVVALVNAALVVRGNEADVGDTANVLASTELGRVVEDEGVEEGDQRSTLAASGLVGDTEVGDGGNTSDGGEESALSHGKGGLNLALLRHGEEPDGLTVGANGVNGLQRNVVLLGELDGSIGEGLAEEDVDLRKLLRGGLVVENHLHDTLLDRGLKGNLVVLEHLEVHLGLGGLLSESAERAVDTILITGQHWPHETNSIIIITYHGGSAVHTEDGHVQGVAGGTIDAVGDSHLDCGMEDA